MSDRPPRNVQEERTPGARGLLAVARRRHGPGVVVHPAAAAHVLFAADAPASVTVRIEGGEGQDHDLDAGDLAFCPAGWRSRWAWHTDVATTYVLLDPDAVRAVLGPDPGLRPLPRFQDGLLRESVRAVAQAADAHGYVEPDYAGAVLRLVARHLALAHNDRADGPRAETALPPDAVLRVEALVRAHLDEDLDLGRLARVAHLSPDHFARRFQAATGETPHQYVTRRRVEAARRRLAETAQPVADVARAVGYRSASHFSQVFRRHVGVTPHDYRAAAR